MEERPKVQASFELILGEGGEGRNIGCWSIHENLLYSIFVDQNKLAMVSKKKRKKLRIFDLMSKFIGSRNSLQCRSHHQKLIQKLGEIKGIINAFKNYFGKETYRQNYRLYTGKMIPAGVLPEAAVVKNEDEGCLDYSVESLKVGESESRLSPAAGEVEVKAEEQEGGEEEARGATVGVACKSESRIQYYAAYSYYIPNSMLPFQFFAALYPLQTSQ